MDHVATSSGSVYTLQQHFRSREVLLHDVTIRIHHMAKHILPPDESELPPPKIPWNKNVSMSMVATTTYIPYSGEAQATSSSSDTFILHNFREFLFLYPFDNMETAVDIMRFTHIPICHDFRVPMLPVQPTNLVVALASCDILVFDPLHGLDTSSHHNRNGGVCSSPIAAAKWVQQSHTEFAVAHENGAIYVYDHTFQDESSYDSMDIEQPEAEFTLLKQREDRTNPVACWHVSSQAIYDLAFSPNGKYMACVGKTGALTVFQYHMQRKIAMMQSHFGALTCLSWSPNSLYIVTGGQDDLVTLWSLQHNSALARCEGHESWVKTVRAMLRRPPPVPSRFHACR
ncbi:hypothetical protein, variant [Aphanomyces invadans]|uniref:Uncharacterized protein n=1 Tax=Aphanomyces invadans TaxID=157072 RepID=A0A024UAK3_9STRA|nr:hypothetical protein, variant [Aphanomyces invadans]ETW03411.1 hypothetical protein, variant [Aphanomyces invadans]|eukprot:XP_008867640.1 hypothetical protein, variant [Aphanomyces invadans]